MCAARNKYVREILDTLQGHTEELRDIPPERLDWAPTSAFLRFYHETSGRDRDALIQAMGLVLADASAPAGILAELVAIASSLDVSQVEPEVRRLRKKPIAASRPLREAIDNFITYRELGTKLVPQLGTNGAYAKPSRASRAKPRTA